ncbi:ATPase [Vibrio rotiferianus]|uniref:ATPase n=1 Tax=Vibrio rotiferianus TaxID=190895 RepID=UPI0028960858|nr:conserved exported hypothetical protein [Vibrio rotiferianus]CAH1558571.1 conserved exported hypothetical protein [Vibrio rotiferianus]
MHSLFSQWLVISSITCCSFALFAKEQPQCNENSWNNNLTQFNRLESTYNRHATTYNQLLNEHKQRRLLTQTFSEPDISLLWQSESKKALLENQLNAARLFVNKVKENANLVRKLSGVLDSNANNWRKIALGCQQEQYQVNQIVADWYHTQALELGSQINQLTTQFDALKAQYDREVATLLRVQNPSN